MNGPLTNRKLTFPKQALVFRCLQYECFENNVGKREKLLVTSNFSFSHSFFFFFFFLLSFSFLTLLEID